jgi:hypothetical protein
VLTQLGARLAVAGAAAAAGGAPPSSLSFPHPLLVRARDARSEEGGAGGRDLAPLHCAAVGAALGLVAARYARAAGRQ